MGEAPARAQPVFVCGLGRSGTTWVASSLGQSPELTYIGEAWLLERLYELVDWFTTVRNEWRFASWAMAGVDRDVFVARLGGWYEEILALASGGRRYVEKTPNWNVSHLDLLGELLPDGYFVLVYRDGRNVVASLETHRARRGAEFDFVDECRRWARTMDIFERVRTSGELRNFRLLRYEDLLQDFDSVFAELCRFVGVPEFRPDPDWPNTSFPGAIGRGDFATRWQSWPADRKAIFKEHAASQLVAWGYAADEDW